jgi:hypothetical protein
MKKLLKFVILLSLLGCETRIGHTISQNDESISS